MNYSKTEDYITEYGTDDVPSSDLDRVARAISRASRLADTFIRASGINVPLTDDKAIEDIKGHVLDIARYFSWSDNPTEEMRKRYEDSIKFLESISTGKVRIVTETQESPKQGFTNIKLVRS